MLVQVCGSVLIAIKASSNSFRDEILITFCKEYETLYRASMCTPNMHLHLHLKDSLLDYGPVYAFWCFPFERYNGIFQSFQKNWICTELQIMNKFVNYQHCITLQSTITYQDEFMWIIEMNNFHEGPLLQTRTDSSKLHTYYKNATCNLEKIDTTERHLYSSVSAKYEMLFSSEEVRWLHSVYNALYLNSEIAYIPMAHEVFYEIDIFGEQFTSVKSKGNHSPVVTAYWPASLEQNGPTCELNAGAIQYFFPHTISIIMPFNGTDEPQQISHLFSRVHWFEKHPCQEVLPYPLKVFATLTTKGGSSTFLPLSRIMSRCAVCDTTAKFDFVTDHVLLLCPTNKKIHL